MKILLTNLIGYTYVYQQSKHSLYILVLATSSLRYLLLSHLDDMFQPLHWAIFRSTIVQNMLESTTGRNAHYGMYSELQVKLTSLHIKLILKFIRRDIVAKIYKI